MLTSRTAQPLRLELLNQQLCTYYSWNCSNRKTEQLDTSAWFVRSCRYSNLWTPDDERNSRSKHVQLQKSFRIHTKKVHLVGLFM